jgi:hypothetical protein
MVSFAISGGSGLTLGWAGAFERSDDNPEGLERVAVCSGVDEGEAVAEAEGDEGKGLLEKTEASIEGSAGIP